MKRTLICLLTAVLLLTGFCGCGDKSLLEPGDPVTLTMWHVYGEQSDSPMNRLVEEFNATEGSRRGILIKVTNVSNSNKLMGSLTRADLGEPGAPELPDLFSAPRNAIDFFGADRLVNFDDWFTPEELAEYVPEFVEDGRVRDTGELVIFPISKSSYSLFLNGSQFARFSADTGITYADLTDWDGFFAAAEAYYAWSGGKPFCAFDYLLRHVELEMEAGGSAPLLREDGWYDVSEASLQDSFLRFARPLAKGHIVVSDLYANTQVMTGEVLGGIGSSAAIGYYNDTVTYSDNTSEPMDLQVLPLPRSGKEQWVYPVSGVGLAAIKTTEQKAEAAAVFVRWLTQPARNLAFVMETGYMPVRSGAFDAIADSTFPTEGYSSLYAAIKRMRNEGVPSVIEHSGDYYARANALYDDMRESCPTMAARIAEGEDAELLAQELWSFFLAAK